jgi:hypothetical protein
METPLVCTGAWPSPSRLLVTFVKGFMASSAPESYTSCQRVLSCRYAAAYPLTSVAKERGHAAASEREVRVEWHMDGLRVLAVERRNDRLHDRHRLQ